MSAGQKERVAGSMVRLMLATGKFKGQIFEDISVLKTNSDGTYRQEK